ncbi:MAG: response regulator [Anaerolineae bacterium]|nr:response regulator [Anaerolineae bacterium]
MSDSPISEALVVDDNWYNRNLISMALTRAGYSVAEAENGTEALAILASRSFDLLVLDLAMPEVPGATVLHHVRQQPQHDQMQIIIITANAYMTTDELDDEADFIMYKPFSIIEFSDFARRLANRWRDTNGSI